MTSWAWLIAQLTALNSSKHHFFFLKYTPWTVLHVGFLSVKRDIGKNTPKEVFA